MLGLLNIGDLSLWRLYAGFAVTGLACWYVISRASDLTSQLALGVPVVVVGVLAAFYWQSRAQ